MTALNTALAVVIDADKLSQIAIIQELGRLGIPVAAISSATRPAGFASRYPAWKLPSPVPSHEPAYVDFLLSAAPRGVIFCSNDANAENLSRHAGELRAAGFRLLLSGPEVLDRVVSKDRLHETARECGVAVPKCAPVSTAAELETMIQEFGLPLILKSTNLAGGVYRFVPSCEAAAGVFREMTGIVTSDAFRHRGTRLMAQQWIPQEGVRLWNYNACVKNGEILGCFMGERVRTDVRADGTLGSVLLYGRTAYHAAIAEDNRRLLRHIGFSGIVETEWSERASGRGVRYLYDFNPRPSGNIRWASRSGVSLVLQYYRAALELPVPARVMRDGIVYAKVLYNPCDWLEALTNPRFTAMQKLAVLREDLAAVAGCWRHAVDVLDPRDPGPTLRVCAGLAAALGESAHRLCERLRPRGLRHARTSEMRAR